MTSPRVIPTGNWSRPKLGNDGGLAALSPQGRTGSGHRGDTAWASTAPAQRHQDRQQQVRGAGLEQDRRLGRGRSPRRVRRLHAELQGDPAQHAGARAAAGAILRGLHEACTRRRRRSRRRTPRRRASSSSRTSGRSASRRLGETAGFLTGYYEPIVDGSREPTEEFVHPLYRTPAGLLRGGKRLKAASFGSKKQGREAGGRNGKKSGKSAKAKAALHSPMDAMAAAKPAKAGKKARRGGRKLVSFYDRAAIDDGVLKGRNLETGLSQGSDRLVLHPHPGLGARAAAPTASCCASITTRRTATRTSRSANG